MDAAQRRRHAALRGALLPHTNRAIKTESGKISAQTLALVITRAIGGGLHEDLDLTNHGQELICFNLELVLRSDFTDIFEVRSGEFVRHGRITTEWNQLSQSLVTTYRNRDFLRVVEVRAEMATSPAVYANGRLSFAVELPPAARWHTCLTYTLSDGGQTLEPPRNAASSTKQRARFVGRSTIGPPA